MTKSELHEAFLAWSDRKRIASEKQLDGIMAAWGFKRNTTPFPWQAHGEK